MRSSSTHFLKRSNVFFNFAPPGPEASMAPRKNPSRSKLVSRPRPQPPKHGSSPRGAQGLLLAGKVRALIDGRFAVSSDDIRSCAHDVLRHRVMVNFQGQADGVTPDHVISAVLENVKPPSS